MEEQEFVARQEMRATSGWEDYTVVFNSGDNRFFHIGVRLGTPYNVSDSSTTTSATSGTAYVRGINFTEVSEVVTPAHTVRRANGNLVRNSDFVRYQVDGIMPELAVVNESSTNPVTKYGLAFAGFEVDGDEWRPDGWRIFRGEPSKVGVNLGRWRSAPANISDRSIEHINYFEMRLDSSYAYIFQRLRLRRNTNYVISFDYWIQGPDGADLKFEVTDNKYDPVGLHAAFLPDPFYPGFENTVVNSLRNPSNQNPDWMQYTAFVNSNDVRRADFAIRVGSVNCNVTGTVRISNITVRPVETAVLTPNQDRMFNNIQASEAGIYNLARFRGTALTIAGGIVYVIFAVLLLLAGVFVAAWRLSTIKAKKEADDDAPADTPTAPENEIAVAEVSVENIEVDGSAESEAVAETLKITEPKRKNGILARVKNRFSNKWSAANYVQLLVVFVAAGFLIRLWAASIVRGYRPEINFYIDGAFLPLNQIVDKGLFNGSLFYTLWMRMISGMGLNPAGSGFLLWMKLPLIFADLGIGILLYFAIKKLWNARAGLIVSAFMLLNPAMFLVSAQWGSHIMLPAFFILLALVFLLRKNTIGMLLSYAAALVMGVEALWLAPVFAVYAIYLFISGGGALFGKPKKGEKKEKFAKKLIPGKASSNFYLVPAALSLAVLVYWLFTLPLAPPPELIEGVEVAVDFNPFYSLLIAPFINNPNLTLGAFNIFGMAGLSELTIADPERQTLIVTSVFAAILFLIALVTAFVLAPRPNYRNIILISGLALILVFMLAFGITPVFYVLLLPVLALAFATFRDKRLLMCLGIFSLILIINAGSVMANAIYFNWHPDFMLGLNDTMFNPDYAGYFMLTSRPFLIIMSVLQAMGALYYVYVALDIMFTRKTKPLKVKENAKFKDALKGFVSLK
jgi:hypothetical protein